MATKMSRRNTNMATTTDAEAKMASENDFPKELNEKVVAFHSSLESIEEVLQPLFESSVSETREKLEALDRAKFDLVAAYALNSLFWIYLHTKGENPYEHGIKTELERVRGYMSKVKEIMDKAKAPRLNVAAAKRFVTNSLWTPKDNEENSEEEEASAAASTDAIQNAEKPAGRKRAKKRKKH